MLNAKAFANATSIVAVIYYVVCTLLSYIAPDLIFGIAKSWMHTINLESVKTTLNLDVGTLLLGLVSLITITWITMYGTVWLYNRLAK